MKPLRKLILTVFICFVVFGALTACQSQNASNVSKVPSVEAVMATPNIATFAPTESTPPLVSVEDDADQAESVVVNALLAWNEKPNRMKVSTVAEDGSLQENAIEFIPPDRKHIIADDGEYIVANNKVYTRTGTQENWQEVQIPASAFLGEENVTEDSIRSTVSAVQFIRKDSFNNLDVHIYGYTSTTISNGVELTGEVELWVGVVDNLPYKMILNGETLSASTDPNTGESHLQTVIMRTTTLITFDPNIQIEAPLP